MDPFEAIDQAAPAGGVHRVVDAQLGEAADQPRMVLRPAEGHAAVHRDHFVDAVAEDEAAVERRDLRFFDRKELAIQVNDHRRVLVIA
jgi:hypothetical protein